MTIKSQVDLSPIVTIESQVDLSPIKKTIYNINHEKLLELEIGYAYSKLNDLQFDKDCEQYQCVMAMDNYLHSKNFTSPPRRTHSDCLHPWTMPLITWT